MTIGAADMRQHVTVVGWTFIAYHGFIALCGVIFFVSATLLITQGNPRAFLVYGWAFTAIALVIVLLAAPGVIAGIGLLKFQRWARILAIVVAVVNLLVVPVGTIVGVYALWVLLNKEVCDEMK